MAAKNIEHLTRQKYASEAVKLNREKYLNMPIEEKRKLYKCKANFIMLKDIPTWQEYYINEKLDKRKCIINLL